MSIALTPIALSVVAETLGSERGLLGVALVIVALGLASIDGLVAVTRAIWNSGHRCQRFVSS